MRWTHGVDRALRRLPQQQASALEVRMLRPRGDVASVGQANRGPSRPGLWPCRRGEVRPNDSKLVLGNYEIGHVAHFEGLLDDLRLYRRALTPEEIRAHAAVHPTREKNGHH
jgi:hypothetical protein